MRPRLVRLAVLSLLLFAPAARADDLANFNAAAEAAATHQRVALGYLRTGNVDLAALEIDRMRAAWGKVTALKRPAALNRDPQLYTTTMLDVTTRLVGASIMIDSGRPDAARQSLEAIRAELTALRKANGIVVLADCVGEANAAMDELMAFNDRALVWGKPQTGAAISDAASSYARSLERCDGMASEQIRNSGEFRRLIDGAKNSLSQIPKAITERDADLLHRLADRIALLRQSARIPLRLKPARFFCSSCQRHRQRIVRIEPAVAVLALVALGKAARIACSDGRWNSSRLALDCSDDLRRCARCGCADKAAAPRRCVRSCQRARQHRAVLDRHRRALREIRQRRMRGVAQQRARARAPVADRRPVEQRPAIACVLVGGVDHGLDRRMPAAIVAP